MTQYKVIETILNKSNESRPIIEVVEPDDENIPHEINKKPDEEEPTLFELMMKTQAEAQREKDMIQEQNNEDKDTIGKGFKKGFLSNGFKNKTTTTTTTTTTTKTITQNKSKQNETLKNSDSSEESPIITISANTNKSSNLIINEVQKALAEEENPLLKQLKQGGIANNQ
jgi:hypothetical protein